MTSSEASAKRIVERLLADLDEGRLRREIDDPIDRAAGEFLIEPESTESHQVFLEVTGRLVQQMYERGLRVPRRLSLRQSRAEAIFLLQQGYRGTYSIGYEAALVDAAGTAPAGLPVVAGHLIEIIRTGERHKYVRGAMARCLAGEHWETRCAVTALLLGRWAPFLSPALHRCHPGQLADEIPTLVDIYLTTERVLGQLGRESRQHGGFFGGP
ncbi:MAG: hypothetical protein KJ749_03295 [Planctomycetes bacterium]|nr:hypothetical protein [Planctomycetota bacterium]